MFLFFQCQYLWPFSNLHSAPIERTPPLHFYLRTAPTAVYLLPGLILTPTSDKLTQLDIILALQISRLKKKRDPTYPYAFDRVSPSFTILIRHILLLRAVTWITSNAQQAPWLYLSSLRERPVSRSSFSIPIIWMDR
ncbi:hypothetical protein PCASD_23867 [Puccinia coronata f. sp. avenae]|uniref:Uncharacterized protein n=1 Tax=Puccinia coronata f. sp. avenae TaxID=200324 RepID=A0A2N5RXZ1_9BASI|nr:hypothetical protein PCASD_23867 [Puccinia coronata f. sp. avenae]